MKIFRRKEMRYVPIEKFDETQKSKDLNAILTFSYRHFPYYRKQAVERENVSLKDFPVLTKRGSQELFAECSTRQTGPVKRSINTSGGSTGVPKRFFQDRSFAEWGHETKAYYFRTFLRCEESEISKVVLWGSEQKLFHPLRNMLHLFTSWWANTIFFNTFDLSEQSLAQCVKTLNSKKPFLLKGYASSLYALSQYIQRMSLRVWTPKIIYSSAETLTAEMRATIERVFQTKVYNYYGSREVGPIAGECMKGSMHIFHWMNVLEIVDDMGNPVPHGTSGRILVTNLRNFSMPLIRYEIGDRGAITDRRCACGSPLPILERIEGRISDNFLTKDDSLVHGEYFTHLFYGNSWIEEFQVVQETVESIVIYFTEMPSSDLPQREHDQRTIDEKIRRVMGQACTIRWELVPSIPRTPMGKRLFTRSLLHE